MPRPPRTAVGGLVYHVINRANGRREIFASPGDYAAFEAVLGEAVQRSSVRLLSYCILPNHWHLVVWPDEDDALPLFVGWVTMCHAQRYHAAHGTSGTGHLYQGRYRSFPIEQDEHLLTVCRYVERNALRAGLCARAEEWPWCSLHHRWRGSGEVLDMLADWPTPPPSDLVDWINEPLTDDELAAVRHSVQRGRPYGGADWVQRTAAEWGLEPTLRPRGRPRRKGS